MKRIKILEAIGFKYIINKATKEIHYAPRISNKCGIQYLRNGKYATARRVKRLITKKGYNGCVHCFPEQDNG